MDLTTINSSRCPRLASNGTCDLEMVNLILSICNMCSFGPSFKLTESFSVGYCRTLVLHFTLTVISFSTLFTCKIFQLVNLTAIVRAVAETV